MEKYFYSFSGKYHFILRSLMIRVIFTDLGIENIIVATPFFILFFPQILVFFQDYSSGF